MNNANDFIYRLNTPECMIKEIKTWVDVLTTENDEYLRLEFTIDSSILFEQNRQPMLAVSAMFSDNSKSVFASMDNTCGKTTAAGFLCPSDVINFIVSKAYRYKSQEKIPIRSFCFSNARYFEIEISDESIKT